MRYEWLPYNYTLAYENASEGLPLARPLNFRGDNPDPKYADVTDEYLWGDEVLIAPVTEAGARTRKVVFPAGEWINWNNPTLRYKGDSEATVQAPLDQLPMFVRAGSFIPQYTQPIENVTQYNPQFITVRYYPSAKETNYTLFDDDRKSPTSLADGKYQLTTFTGEKSARGIEIAMRTNGGSYVGMPEVRMMTFEIMDVAKPKNVSLSDGTQLEEAGSMKMIRQYGYVYDAATRTLSVRFPWNYTPLSLTIK